VDAGLSDELPLSPPVSFTERMNLKAAVERPQFGQGLLAKRLYSKAAVTKLVKCGAVDFTG